MTVLSLVPPAPIDPQAAVDALKQAMALLAQAGEHLPQIAFLTRAAYDNADTALMVANNEATLAARGE